MLIQMLLGTVILVLSIVTMVQADTVHKPFNDEYLEFSYGQATGGDEWIDCIRVSSPAYRATVTGDVTVELTAPGMEQVKAMCWQQPKFGSTDTWGHDVNLTPNGIKLDDKGNGKFLFPASRFPYGPTTVRIVARNDEGKRDICELQLYNTAGNKWNIGMPADPPAAKGMKLAFADDFDGPLSITHDGRGDARYTAHKPGGGDFSGWQFASPKGDGKPFSQVDSFLRISASKGEHAPKGMSGLIASVDADGNGFTFKAPSYLECRFIAQSAVGTWPAFWTLTTNYLGYKGPKSGKPGVDELDICELYGGLGKGNPNHPGYSIVSHFWRQKNQWGEKKKGISPRAMIMELGGKSYWSTTFHTYGCYIGVEETVYYFDNIEVLRHPTNDVSLDNEHYFLINYAIGGISRWPIDLSRYDEGTDMYVDFVRVYQGQR
ncbi:MAG TPA: hypothetical protein DCM28_14535 [Phycisphaerales bacterium]|nr:hypothetical protein [Phycisphaerales bacterium]